MTPSRSHSRSLRPSYFETKYRADIDPWNFRTSPYEQEKYRATLGALTKSRYQCALELGCGIGVLTAILASRCEQLFALDGSETAIAEATLLELSNVRLKKAFLPGEFPDGAYDLIVLSEILYFFSEQDLLRLADKCLGALKPGGEMILCHWLGETNYPLTGHQASDLFVKATARRRPARSVLHEGIYRLERLSFPS